MEGMERMIERIGRLVCLVTLLALLPASVAKAQGVDAPEPGVCATEPRNVEGIVSLFISGTPVAWSANDVSVEIATGRVASEALQARITETVAEAFACLNAGEMLRFFGLLTDDALVTGFPWMGEILLNGETPAELLDPVPLADADRQILIAVADIRAIAPDRAGAFIVFMDPASGNPGANVLHPEFERQEDRWLIARITEFGNG